MEYTAIDKRLPVSERYRVFADGVELNVIKELRSHYHKRHRIG